MKYLFLCGCPRSGTTALWRTVSGHKKVAVGVERYIHRMIPKFTLTEDYFKKERFFDWKKGDTHFPGPDHIPYYAEIENRYDDCMYYGDKVPPMYVNYETLFNNFKGAHVLFIFRNIFDVAQSYLNRFDNPDDGWKKDHTVAVREWNTSLGKTIQLKKKGAKICCIEYEEFFYDNFDLSQIFTPLGLEMDDDFLFNFKKVIKHGGNLEKQRKDRLTTGQKRYIMHNANFAAYKAILDMKNSFEL